MDFQHRVGGKTGSGPISSAQLQLSRRQRLLQLAEETQDITKNPYLIKNNLGKFECTLCNIVLNTETSFLSHTQGRKHQDNLTRRKLIEERHTRNVPTSTESTKKPVIVRPTIGNPGYQVFKQKDETTNQLSLIFEIHYDRIQENLQPRYRIVSPYETKEKNVDTKYQYVVFAAAPYNNIAFKIPNKEIEKLQGRSYTDWDKEKKIFKLQLYFKQNEAPKK